MPVRSDARSALTVRQAFRPPPMPLFNAASSKVDNTFKNSLS